LQYKQIGRTGLKVSAMSIGTMFFGSQVSEEEAIKTLDLAFEKGINMFDTADAYVLGKSEEIVGKAIKNKRQSVVLATKIGHRGGRGPNDSGLSREHIIQGVEVSLKRLGTDYIDIYYAHTPDYSTPIEETLRAFDQLVQQGKVRYVACSNIRAWQLTKSLWVSDKNNLARYDCIQSVYNQLTRDVEYELLPCCAAEGVGVTVFNPLAAGFLTGKYDPNQPPPADNRFGRERTGKREQELYWSPANFKAVAELKKIAEANGRSLVQFSLAWIINNPVISSAIVGASSAKQLEDNVKAVDIKLTDEEKKACDAVWQELRLPRVFYGS
jgi:aryl-alcohol dehydrogenase-like predicted oxidoreductase